VLAFHIGKRARDTLVGVVHRYVDGRTIFRGQPVFLIPDVEGRFLIRMLPTFLGCILTTVFMGIYTAPL